MKKLIVITILVALMATPALAVPELTLQQVLDSITLLPTPGVSSVNVTADTITDGLDSYWAITGAGGSVETIVIEVAASAGVNTFGVYDRANPANTVQLFSGPQGQGDQAFLSIKADGSVWVNGLDSTVDFAGNAFGYYLGTPPQPQLINYSDTSLNGDGYDHMWALQGKNLDTIQIPGLASGLWTNNEYILGWENTTGGGDQDHQDFVVMVESVTPIIPAPGAILLGSIGVGLVGWLRRRRAL